MGMPLPMARRGLLIALRQRITCAHVRLEVGWRAGGAKEPRASLCVWRDRGGKPRAVPSPPRRRASPPPPVPPSLRCFVRLPAAPPQPALPLDRAVRRATLLIRSFTTGLVCRRVVSRSRTRTMPRTGTRRGRAATTSTNRTVDYETPRGPPSRRIDVNQTVHRARRDPDPIGPPGAPWGTRS